MKKDETFEDWYRDQIEKACGELTYGRHSDTEHIKRTYINRRQYVREAWNHQQKKIDELEKLIKRAIDIVELNSHGEFVNGVFVSHRQACNIYREWLKEKLSKLDEKGYRE